MKVLGVALFNNGQTNPFYLEQETKIHLKNTVQNANTIVVTLEVTSYLELETNKIVHTLKAISDVMVHLSIHFQTFMAKNHRVFCHQSPQFC